MDRPPAILLVTGGDLMPVPDPESQLLVAALAARGVRSELAVWDAPRDWSQTPLVVLRTPWDYHQRPEEFLAAVRRIASVTTLVNPADLVAWNHHKRYLAELAAAGVPVVPLSMVARGAAASVRESALTAFGAEVVVKPAISGGAHGTIRTAADSARAREHLAQLVEDGDALVQPYLPEVQAGEVSLVFFDGALHHAVLKAPAAGDFRVHAEYGGSLASHAPDDAERAVAEAVLAALPCPATYARVDLLPTADGPLLMEVELIDPELFLPLDPGAAPRYAGVLVARLEAIHAGR